MGFLGGDLRSSKSRRIFGVILAVNKIISVAILVGSLSDDTYTIKAWNLEPWTATFITAIHVFFPALVFAAVLVVSVRTSKFYEEVTAPKILS